VAEEPAAEQLAVAHLPVGVTTPRSTLSRSTAPQARSAASSSKATPLPACAAWNGLKYLQFLEILRFLEILEILAPPGNTTRRYAAPRIYQRDGPGLPETAREDLRHALDAADSH
jgi:hypothetical protein